MGTFIEEMERIAVLTPRIIHKLNGRLDSKGKENLLSIVEETIKKIFRPFAEKNDYENFSNNTYSIYIREFEPYRIKINEEILKLLGKNIITILRKTEKLLEEEIFKTAKKYGISSDELIQDLSIMARCGNILFSSENKNNKWDNNSEAFKSILKKLANAATKVDFCLMAIFLLLEEEITLPINHSKKLLNLLLSRVKRNLKIYEKYIYIITCEPSAIEEYRKELLRKIGVRFPKRNGVYNPPFFEPIKVEGEPLSQTIIKERR